MHNTIRNAVFVLISLTLALYYVTYMSLGTSFA